MSSIQVQDVADMVTGTLRDLGRDKMQQIAQTITDYEVMSHLMTKERVVFEDGFGIQKTLLTKIGGNGRHVGLFAQDSSNIIDVLAQMQVPWVQYTNNWSYEVREMLMNRGKSRIVNVVKGRENAAMIDDWESLESAFFDAPDATNPLVPFGLQYWNVKNATTGFNGGAATGFTLVGNVNLTDVPAFKNYTVAYTVVSKEDLIAKLRTMARKINFKSPVDIKDFRRGRGARYRIYVNEVTISAMELLAEAQNDRLGRDLAPMDDVTSFKRNALNYIPTLDDDTSNPFYFNDMSVFYPYVLSGDFFRKTVSAKNNGQHNVITVHTDLSYNYLCVDRRRLGVAYVV